MDGLGYIFEMVRKHGVVQVMAMGEQDRVTKEEIFKLKYIDDEKNVGGIAGTESMIRHVIQAEIVDEHQEAEKVEGAL